MSEINIRKRNQFSKFLRLFRSNFIEHGRDLNITITDRIIEAIDDTIIQVETIEGYEDFISEQKLYEQERKIVSNEIFGHSGAHIVATKTSAYLELYNFIRSIASDGVFNDLNRASRHMEFSQLVLDWLRGIDRELREKAVDILASHHSVFKTENELAHTIEMLCQQLHWSATNPEVSGLLHSAGAEKILEKIWEKE